MATGTVSQPMTVDEFLALPDDGVERWLVRGELKEWGTTTRNRNHSHCQPRVGRALLNWLDTQPEPRGDVYAGDALFRLQRDPKVIVGVDAAYISPEQNSRLVVKDRIIPFAPTLAVEILSPSDTMERIAEKLELYSEAGVPLVWIIDCDDLTVLVYRPGEEPELFTVKQELTAEPHLPGFRYPVAGLFR